MASSHAIKPAGGDTAAGHVMEAHTALALERELVGGRRAAAHRPATGFNAEWRYPSLSSPR